MCYYDDLILKTVVCSGTWHKKTCALKCKYCVGQISFISYMTFPIRNCSRWLLTTLLTSRLTERCLREWRKCFGVHITAQPSTPTAWPRKFKFTVILRDNFRHLTGGHFFHIHACIGTKTHTLYSVKIHKFDSQVTVQLYISCQMSTYPVSKTTLPRTTFRNGMEFH